MATDVLPTSAFISPQFFLIEGSSKRESHVFFKEAGKVQPRMQSTQQMTKRNGRPDVITLD
ncbi:hypothetical protein CRE_08369 [Caenorhabditis remanei]|uniref:Uncharacterized protein n=1 Tax=Caenorhabditis remanei TaxID=31234 RepID=E3MPD6_CAERE|nr:hypothetical protein CRE_08369 [Caenorhabditis remanei]